jgi:hypothetical protein
MDGSAKEYPSPSTIEKIRRNPSPDDEELQNLIEIAIEIAEQQRFFHWEIEFPEIFGGSSPGFDCVLGNPPWDKVKLEEREWFAGKVPEIAESDSKGHRTRLINELEDTNSDLYEKWQLSSKRSSQTSKFIRESGRFPLSGNGEINTYPVFTEVVTKEVIAPTGRGGMVVKTGVATDYRTQDLFGYLVEEDRLVSLYDFVNKKGIFPDVAPDERFCLLTTTGSSISTAEVQFSFYSESLEEMRDENKRYTLTTDQISKINPNTKSCPVFRSQQDRDITVPLYDQFPVIWNEEASSNPWGISYHRMVDLSTDSGLFEDNKKEELEEAGFSLDKNIFKRDNDKYYPLYEAKFIQQFDHRFGTFEGIERENRFIRRASTNTPTYDQESDPEFEVIPRYWVSEDDFDDVTDSIEWDEDWVFSFRDIARVTSDSRTAMGTICPYYPFGNTAPILTFSGDDLERRALLFTSLYTSFVFDYALRQSMGGTHVNLYILKQLPMPDPEELDEYHVHKENGVRSASSFLEKRALRLVWTSHSLDPLGSAISYQDSPTIWKGEERRTMRAEIDAVIAHIYGLSREEFEHILSSFSILADKERDEYGEYRRKEECLEMFDKFTVKT